MPRIVSCHLRRCSQNHKSDRTEEAPPRPPCKGSRGLSLARVYVKHLSRIIHATDEFMDTMVTHYQSQLQGPIVYGPPEKPGRSGGGFRRPRRPESCAPVPAQAGTSRGVGDRNGSLVGGRRHRREQGLLLKYPVPWSLRKGERRPCFQRPGPLRADPKGWLFMRGKGGGFRAVLAGPEGNLSAIPAALSRSRGALSPAGP